LKAEKPKQRFSHGLTAYQQMFWPKMAFDLDFNNDMVQRAANQRHSGMPNMTEITTAYTQQFKVPQKSASTSALPVDVLEGNFSRLGCGWDVTPMSHTRDKHRAPPREMYRESPIVPPPKDNLGSSKELKTDFWTTRYSMEHTQGAAPSDAKQTLQSPPVGDKVALAKRLEESRMTSSYKHTFRSPFNQAFNELSPKDSISFSGTRNEGARFAAMSDIAKFCTGVIWRPHSEANLAVAEKLQGARRAQLDNVQQPRQRT
jgi:hypothetical protein